MTSFSVSQSQPLHLQPANNRSSRRGTILGPNLTEGRNSEVWVEFESAGCSSCRSVCKKPTRSLSLPIHGLPANASSGCQVEMSMSIGSQISLLLNSLILPLVGFIAGAGIAHELNFSDLLGVVFAVSGLGLGMLFCRKSPGHQISIEEVS